MSDGAEELGSMGSRPAAGGGEALRTRRLAGNFLLLTLGELIAKLITLVAFTYLARVFGPEQYGRLEFVLAAMVFFTLPVDFGLGVYGAREIARRPGRAASLIRDVCALRLLLACCSFLLLSAFVWLLPGGGDVRLLLTLYGLSLFAIPALLQWFFQGRDLMHWVAVASVVRQGTFALLVFLLVRTGTRLYVVGLCECAAVAAVAVTCVSIVRRGGPRRLPRFRIRPRVLLSRFRAASPIGLSELAWVFLWYAPTVQLGFLVADETLGWFGGSHRLVMALHTFVWLYFFNLLPTLSRCASLSGGHLQGLMRRSLATACWGGIFVAFMAVLFSPQILAILYGPDYSGGASLLSILIWLIPVAMISGHYRYNLIVHNLQKLEFLCTAAAAAVCVALGFVLVPVWGAMGAAVAVLGANVVNLGLAYGFAQHRTAEVPFLPQLVKPLLATAVAVSVFLALAGPSPWLAGAAAAGGYLGLYVVSQGRTLLMIAFPK